tara:strand:+ start:173 stop:1300 length:1128 start_codon:yes stop_codon:yes gene_type:complete
MLKNKIYNYLTIEIFKNFITILLTFTAIAWTVRAVNFLDLMIEDGYTAKIYFQYSLLNIFTIITRFIPLSFLLAIVMSITKFERQNELFILWTTGLNKIKIVNIFFLFSFLITLFQIILGLIVNPYTLNKSRALLRDTNDKQINSVLKANDFSDTFEGITFYIDKKNSNNELINIFIKDSSGSLNTIINESDGSVDTTIFSKKGIVVGQKLILFNGTIQTLNKKKEIKNIGFRRTELSSSSFTTRTITKPKIQETSSYELFKCLRDNFSQDCVLGKNKQIVIETLSRRIGMPLYVPLISVIASFLLINKKEKKYSYLKKYIIFGFGFVVLLCGEVLLRFSGFSFTNFVLYFSSPIILLIILYSILIKLMYAKKSF